MSAYRPPFQLTHPMLTRVAEIAELLGRWKRTDPVADPVTDPVDQLILMPGGVLAGPLCNAVFIRKLLAQPNT